MSPRWHVIMACVLMTLSFLLTTYVATMTYHYGVSSYDILFPSNDVVATMTCLSGERSYDIVFPSDDVVATMTYHSCECSYYILILSGNVCRYDDVSFWCVFLCHSLSFWQRMSPRWRVILVCVLATFYFLLPTNVATMTSHYGVSSYDILLSDKVCRHDDMSLWCVFLGHFLSF